MLWLASKLDSRFLRSLSFGAYALALGRLLAIDLTRQYSGALPADLVWSTYLPILGNHLLTIGGPIAAIGGAWFLLKSPPAAAPSMQVPRAPGAAPDPDAPSPVVVVATLAIALVFLYLHIELYRTCAFFYAPLAYPSLSVLWLALGAFLLALFRRNGSQAILALLGILAGLFAAKLLLLDAAQWRPDLDGLLYPYGWTPVLAGIRALDFGLCIGLFALLFARLRAAKDSRPLAIGAGIGALVLLFTVLTFELNTVLHRFLPGMRAGGLTLLWALYALALLLGGLRRAVRGLRYAGLALFLLVVGKIFLVDLDGLESIYRIVAFLILGIVLFLAALLYLRNRARFQQNSAGPGKE